MLRAAGHRAILADPGAAPACDALLALHARKSAASVARSRKEAPERPILVALTGTDLYVDIHRDEQAKRSLELADLLIVLHGRASEELPPRLRGKVRVVPQSAPPVRATPRASRHTFEVAVVGHLRDEKDPLRTALAARLLPEASRVQVVHAGAPLTPGWKRAALREARENPRYRYLGELPPAKARALIARARVLSLTSRLEGGANVVSEAVAAGTPILASRIPAMEAILGEDHPGLFEFGATKKLADLLVRVERDPAFLRELARRSRALRKSLSPARERSLLISVVEEAAGRSSSFGTLPNHLDQQGAGRPTAAVRRRAQRVGRRRADR
jgi:putative glycosyltransferase (TIGR04348 family)